MRLLSITACLVASAFASRLGLSDDQRAFLCLYMTSETDWAGEGINICNFSGLCSVDMPNGLTNNVGSAGPDRDATCHLFSELNCKGDVSASITNPGYADLSTIGFNDKAKSWMCYSS